MLRAECSTNLENHQVVDGLERLPRCRHLTASRAKFSAYQRVLNLNAQAFRALDAPALVGPKHWTVLFDSNGFISPIYRYGHYPTEFLSRIRQYSFGLKPGMEKWSVLVHRVSMDLLKFMICIYCIA